MEKDKLRKYNLPKWLLVMATIFLASMIIVIGAVYLYNLNYTNKIYMGVKVGNISLAGKNKEQAKALVQAQIDKLTNQGIEFRYRNNKLVVEPIVSTGSETGMAYELWLYDAQNIVDKLYKIGRQGTWFENMASQLKLIIAGLKNNEVDYILKEDELRRELKDYFKKWEKHGRAAELVLENNKLVISQQESGFVFDYNKTIEAVKQNLGKINNNGISMVLIVDRPEVTKSESEFLLPEAEAILDLAPLTLSFRKPDYYYGRKRFEQVSWQINKSVLIEWLKLQLNNKKEVSLGINRQKTKIYLSQLAKKINTPAKDAKFEIKDGKVIEWQSSQDGFSLNIQETINQLARELIENKHSQVELVLSADKSKITNENVNNLGINEVIGVGQSNFSGSPQNRRHNIQVGAETLNGLLIKPNEEFSLLGSLGEIDAAAGYKPELVIKEGKTIAEYGGGLCQIGTTMFRLVINSGLPIIQRRNHSYRVSYYEPAGTDATIYSPEPDFKFINDTQDYLLLQTRIEGDILIFEFWGTSDGRQVETSKPIIYNIVAPGEPEYEESTELEQGEKKRIEYAHSGADAYFKRIITWPKESSREAVEEIWYSHYVPWKERWLIGVEKKSTTTSEQILN